MIIIVLLILTTSVGFSQNQSLSNFIPEGYILFEQYSGDLNNDNLEDCVLIIKNTKEENVVTNRFDKKVDRNRRGIIVLLKRGDSYEVAVKNLDCFTSENEDGGVYYAPELRINLENGTLKINYSHGRYGFWEYIFRYNKSDFELIGYESSENHGPVVNNKTSINFLTKKKLMSENIYKNLEDEPEVFKETWVQIKIDNLIKLSEIQAFEEQVTPYFYRMNLNQKQIRTLEKLRDTLLPKLMSGEVRVQL